MGQVEYAIEAIKLGSTAIGIQTSEGVILAVEKRITSPLMEPTSIEDRRDRQPHRVRLLRPHRRLQDPDRPGSGGEPEPLVHLRREDAGGVRSPGCV